jgi:hypothetical protein
MSTRRKKQELRTDLQYINHLYTSNPYYRHIEKKKSNFQRGEGDIEML